MEELEAERLLGSGVDILLCLSVPCHKKMGGSRPENAEKVTKALPDEPSELDGLHHKINGMC